MPKFNVSLDLYVPVLVEVEAENEEAAELKVLEWPRKDLLKLANTEESAIGINIDGISLGEQD